MHRVVIYGNGGSGKSRLASRLADHLGAEHIEIDELAHDTRTAGRARALSRLGTGSANP